MGRRLGFWGYCFQGRSVKIGGIGSFGGGKIYRLGEEINLELNLPKFSFSQKMATNFYTN